MAVPRGSFRKSLKETLKREREELEDVLHSELAERLGDGYSRRYADPLDTADLSFFGLQESVGIRLVDIRQEELDKTLQAERKLNDGSYGICELCGGEISEQRLSAMPSAIYCIRCAERLESDYAGGRRFVF